MEQIITIDQCNGMWQVKYEGVVIYKTQKVDKANMYANHLRTSHQPLTIGDVKQVKTDSDVLDS